MVKIISISHSSTGYPEITKCKIPFDGAVQRGHIYCICNNVLNGDLETSNVYAISLDTLEYDESDDNLAKCVVITDDMLLEGDFEDDDAIFPGCSFFLSTLSDTVQGLLPSQEGHFVATEVFHSNDRLIVRFKRIY